MVRIDVQLDNDLSLVEQAKDLQVSAYMDQMTGKVVMVFINHTQEDKAIIKKCDYTSLGRKSKKNKH